MKISSRFNPVVLQSSYQLSIHCRQVDWRSSRVFNLKEGVDYTFDDDKRMWTMNIVTEVEMDLD